MGGMFGGGGGSKKSSTDKKSTTAESIETADGTVYDRRGSTTAAAMTPAPAQPMGASPAPVPAPKMEPMETVLPSASSSLSAKRKSPAGTLAGQSYGFG
jgi:hypothetical protein